MSVVSSTQQTSSALSTSKAINSRKLSILVIADAWIPIPPSGYGGSERVVDLMCRCLSSAGHSVRLLAAPGSKDFGNGVVTHRPPSKHYLSRAFRKLWFQWLLLRATRGVDIVVNHGRIDYLEGLYRTRIPVVHWFHNAFVGDEVAFIHSRRKKGDVFVGVSRYHVSTHPQRDQFKVVENALETSSLPFYAAAEGPGYALFLGRLTRHKGAHVAIDVCKRAGLPLVIAGNKSSEASEAGYFENEIEPHLGEHCRWVGPYNEEKRLELLAGAKVVLFPIQGAVETFGLVLVEALASGVPVIATARCSTPEIVLHGVNGFLCDTVEEMVSALDRLPGLDRRRCRESVVSRFDRSVFSSKVQAVLNQTLEEVTS